ncbi:MAG: DUF433 domain-containing protein [Pyrinomonadaceae bacterium]
MSTVTATHIEIDGAGVAWITGANIKVIEVMLDKLAYGWSPEEIHFQHPSLSLAQIHTAFAITTIIRPSSTRKLSDNLRKSSPSRRKRATRLGSGGCARAGSCRERAAIYGRSHTLCDHDRAAVARAERADSSA